MAAEGLDIKSLSSLILATPRTDITQAVGRILRVKRERPLVVDIVDTHDVFRRQYSKRKTFYRKNKYTVMESDNTRYFKDEWDEVKPKKRGKKKKEIDKKDEIKKIANTTNNLFVGSTTELQKLLKNESEIVNVTPKKE